MLNHLSSIDRQCAMNWRGLITLMFVGVCIVPNVRAEVPLLLEQAVSRSLASNPSLAAEAADLEAARMRAERLGLAPRYVVGVESENFGGRRNLAGMNSAETTIRLGRVIELGGKRAARQALGAAEVTRQRNMSETARIDIASRTTSRFIAVLAAQQRRVYVQEKVKFAETVRREVARWVAAARNPESDLRAAEIALATAELERENTEHILSSAKTTLAASWGAFSPDFTSVAGNLNELPAIDSLETLVARLPMSTTQRAALLEAETVRAQRRVAEANAKPDIDVSLGVRRFEATHDQALVMSISIPLGSKPRSSLSIAEADAQLAAIESRRDAQRFESYQTLVDRYQELMHARHEYEALRNTMLPKAEQAFAFTRRGFESGRFTFIALTQAQRTLFELRDRSVDASVRYHTVLIEVERLTAVLPELTP